MSGPLHLSWRHLRHHPWQTLALVLSLALVFFLPFGLNTVVSSSSELLRARAASTPLIVAAKGSSTDASLSSLYFQKKDLPQIQYEDFKFLKRSTKAPAIPLLLGHSASDAPIVGTTLNYFSQRSLEFSSGSLFRRLGDCVLGAAAAERLNLFPGDHIVSTPDNVFDLAGTYPLKMRITGVLEPTNTPDDEAVFVDLKTTWIIRGFAHGHDDLTESDFLPGPERRANAAVREFTEITDDNIDTFHFHGDRDTYPLTSVLLFPETTRESTLLLGQFEKPDLTTQIIRPEETLAELAETLFSIRKIIFPALVIVAAVALLLAALVYALSLRLRQSEFATYKKIGAAPRTLLYLKSIDAVFVLTAAALLALLANFVTAALAPAALQLLLQL